MDKVLSRWHQFEWALAERGEVNGAGRVADVELAPCVRDVDLGLGLVVALNYFLSQYVLLTTLNLLFAFAFAVLLRSIEYI